MTRTDRGFAFFARVLMASLFVVAGTRKLLGFAMTVGYFAKLGLPLPEVVACIAIAIEIGGAVLLVIGYRQTPVAIGMALFTIGTALIAHRFWDVSDPKLFDSQLNNFLKNVAIVGGFVMIAIDGRRRGRA